MDFIFPFAVPASMVSMVVANFIETFHIESYISATRQLNTLLVVVIWISVLLTHKKEVLRNAFFAIVMANAKHRCNTCTDKAKITKLK